MILDIRHFQKMSKALDYVLDHVKNLGTTLIIPEAFTIDETVVVPENVCLKFIPITGKFIITEGNVLTVNGWIEAGKYQIFDGNGHVTGNPKVDFIYPEWFSPTVTTDLTSVKRISEDYTTTFFDKCILVDASAAPVTITLATGITRKVSVKKIDSSSNEVIIQPSSGVIDGQTSISIEIPYASYTLVSDGNNWWIE